MSFSSKIKEEFSKNIPNKLDLVKFEVLGYLLSGNTNIENNKIIFVTENEFNIEKLYKMLFKLEIDYEPDKDGKNYKAIIDSYQISSEKFDLSTINQEEQIKALVRGCFLGAGSLSNPESKYHLEITITDLKNAEYIQKICYNYGINLKLLSKKEKYILYLKDGEEISNFLAFIGANNAVLKFEEIRVIREIKNNVNRKVNCETANLNKTVNAAMNIIEDINYLKKINKFNELDKELIQLAELRIENPEITIKELGNMLDNKLGKSGVKYRLDKIHNIAMSYKDM